jgi:hypothetical protein
MISTRTPVGADLRSNRPPGVREARSANNGYQEIHHYAASNIGIAQVFNRTRYYLLGCNTRWKMPNRRNVGGH